jgi:hypothetical protein
MSAAHVTSALWRRIGRCGAVKWNVAAQNLPEMRFLDFEHPSDIQLTARASRRAAPLLHFPERPRLAPQPPRTSRARR